MIDELYTFKFFGYHSDDLKPQSNRCVVAVCDECYMYRILKFSHYRDICKKCSDKYRGITRIKTNLIPKEPLSDGWKSKLSDITDNKSSGVYLGSVAETMLSNVYKNVQVMPYGNIGFDFICSKNLKIDVKSSAIGDKYGYWMFIINKNKVADSFLCIAFNSRDDLYNPVHLWIIPGNIVNDLTALKISKSTIDRWFQYELPLDKLVACCSDLNP